MNKLLLVVIGLMLLAIGFLMGRSGDPASAPGPAVGGPAVGGASWNAAAGAYVSETNGTLRFWKVQKGEVVKIVEYSTSLVQGDEGVSKAPAVFKRVIEPASEGAVRAVPAIGNYPQPPMIVPVPSSCGGAGGSCG